MKKIIIVLLVLTALFFTVKPSVRADSKTENLNLLRPPVHHFVPKTQILKDGIMFKSVMISSSGQDKSVESTYFNHQVEWGVEGYSLVGLRVCGLYTTVKWTGNENDLLSPKWVGSSSWSIFPNTVDEISNSWLYYVTGFHGTGEALTKGRFGIGIPTPWGSINIVHTDKSLFTDVYWDGRYYTYYR